MKNTSFLLVLLLISVSSFSQKIENVHAEQQGKQVIVTYDITGAHTDQKFDVKLLYSQNGYDWKQAVNGLTGDIGTSVIAGIYKTITWDALQDTDKLVGTGFTFKVNALINGDVLYHETGTFTDIRDGKTYKWVKIGNQIWMAENLNYIFGYGFSYCYEDEISNCASYGRLYVWEAARVICPKGWHLPNDDEWIELIDFLGGKKVAGGKMKQSGTLFWNTPNKYATNSSGFTAIPSGYRNIYGEYNYLGDFSIFWSFDKNNKNISHAWGIGKETSNVIHVNDESAKSVRCIKDE